VSAFSTFVHLGLHHIADVGAMDHILFLLALAAIYRGRDWRDSLWVVSAFTIGHSVALALAATGALRIPSRLVEFLIPLTIIATGIENIAVRNRSQAPLRGRYRPGFAGVFGLVHGAGFASYLQSLFTGSIVLPLFGFNVGIELGQLLVLGAAGVVLAGADRLFALLRVPGTVPSAHRLRVVTVSLVVVAVAAQMAAARRPW
jgi:HupE/UreJ protein